MDQFQQYIQPFSEQLQSVSISQLHLEGYPAKYLHQLLEHKIYYLRIYADVLNRAIDKAGCIKEEMVIIDYGCGNGLLGLFAKFCQCKAVYLVDQNASFLNAAKELSYALAIDVDAFIEGDILNVETYFSNKALPDAIIGTDVIEHIYDLNTFFNTIATINHRMVTVFTTASVTDNYFKSKQLIKLQYKDEHLGSNALHASAHDKFAGLPFKKIREQFIKNYAPGLQEEKVVNLSIATRGLQKEDILKAVDEFNLSGKVPKPSVHNTNTCDPITGSWTERLLTVDEYRQLYKQAGFTLKVYSGFYNEWQSGVKALALGMANKFINVLKQKGRSITPFIILVGGRKG